MKLACLLSGGKDSLYSAYIANKDHDLVCAITVHAENKESYMFHTPNVLLTQMQSEAMGIPHIVWSSQGEKEEELEDLKEAISEAKEKYHIEGLVTGAVGSVYQASRIQKICYDLGLWCFNPLWQKDQVELLNELLEHHFDIIISGVFAYPLTKNYLGKKLTPELIEDLRQHHIHYQINPAGEGGEIETFVTDCPLFNKSINITSATAEHDNYAGVYNIEGALLESKPESEVRHHDAHKTYCEIADVLIVETNKEELHYYEFVKPIEDMVKASKHNYCLVRLEDFLKIDISQYKKVIIAGTGIQDNDYLAHKEQLIPLLLSLTQPILGICAGAQLLALTRGTELVGQVTIGMQQLEPRGHDALTEGVTQAYFMHQKGLGELHGDLLPTLITENGKYVAAFQVRSKPQFGVLFHPEARNKDIIKLFLESF